jgi:hypothetical protein
LYVTLFVVDEISNALLTIKEFLNYYVDNLLTTTISEGLIIREDALKALGPNVEPEQQQPGDAASYTVNGILNSIILQCRERRVGMNAEEKISRLHLSSNILKFENSVLQGILGKIKDKIKNLNPREWARKGLNAVNIIVKRLKVVFPHLDVIKEFKDHFLNLSDNEDSQESSPSKTT